MRKPRSRAKPTGSGDGAERVRAVRAVRSVCVYCGSSLGADPAYAAAAQALGRSLAGNGIRLVYGGGSFGLMGEIARATLAAGGQITGVIPKFLSEYELAFREAQDIRVTETMHERKQVMFEESDAFVALPGGVGTLEELVEQITWAQIGRHKKPLALLDVGGYWTPLVALLDHMRRSGFIRAELDVELLVLDSPEEVVAALERRANALAATAPVDLSIVRKL